MSKPRKGEMENIVLLPATEDIIELANDLESLPEKTQKFIELIFRYGASDLLSAEEFRFLISYLREKDVTIYELQEKLAQAEQT